MKTRWKLTVAAALALAAGAAAAGEADVVALQVEPRAGAYTFHVTVRHDDTGWNHYADRWEVVAPDGTVIATRTLHHPHVNEQPFRRSLSGVRPPAGVRWVTVRAHDSVHGFGGREVRVELP